MNSDAYLQRLLTQRRVFLDQTAVQSWNFLGDAQGRVDRTHRVVLVRERVAKVDEHAVAEILGNVSIEALDARGAGLLISGYNFGQGFGVETLGELSGADQVAEHHGELAVLALGDLGGRG